MTGCTSVPCLRKLSFVFKYQYDVIPGYDMTRKSETNNNLKKKSPKQNLSNFTKAIYFLNQYKTLFINFYIPNLRVP